MAVVIFLLANNILTHKTLENMNFLKKNHEIQKKNTIDGSKKLIILFVAFFLAFNLTAQEKPVKIVFDVTSSNPKVHQTAVRHVKAMSQAYPDSKFEVVMYSGSIDMVLKDKSTVAKDIEALAKNDNISFVVCQGTLNRHKISDNQLISGLQKVPDGILEIINKQQNGWGYIKESNNN
jgi:hypothetical protein